MTSRKLQSEIDRVLKKVAEGVEEFGQTLEKVYNAATNNQREKYEADLKKEIKKLQRYRDQIKSWISSNEVKEKQPLIEARKLIETQMEQYRSCERETKTKAYSKEGLQMVSNKPDAKSRVRDWIQKCLSSLTTQSNKFETEIEQLSANLDDPDTLERFVTLEHWVERHKFHMDALEKVLRLWENDKVHQRQIDEIRDEVENYIANNQDADFYENEHIYEDAGININIPAKGAENDSDDEGQEKDPAAATAPTIEPEPTKAPNSAATSTAPTIAGSSSSSQPSTAAPSGSSGGISLTSSTGGTSSSSTSSRGAAAGTSKPLRDSGNSVPTVASVAAATSATTGSNPSPPSGRQAATTAASAAAPTPAASSKATGGWKKISASEDVGAASSRDKAKAAEQPGVAAASTREATIAATSPTTAPVAAPSATNNAVANAAAVAPAPTQATAAVVAPTPAVQSVDPKAKYQQMQQIAGIRPTNTNTTPATAPAPAAVNSNSSSNNNNNSTITAPSLGLEGAHSFGSAIGKSGAVASSGERRVPPASAAISPPVVPIGGGSQFPAIAGPGVRNKPETPSSLDKTNDAAYLPPNSESGDAADMRSSKSKIVAPPSSDALRPYNLEMLEASMRRLPEAIDIESRQKQYTPRNPVHTPGYYPATPLPLFDSQVAFEKFDTDTLFFIFYYQQGTYQQYLAARELKNRSWRYHKKYLTWFQRHEEPKEITSEYEQGTYVYFDYETGWCQRKKTEFTFEYRYLEDGAD